ncbi:ras-related protein Rab-34 [Anopheles aquasalis]|uniref:ras-related protein Rab-34 n=1 Tax=Anopheles aquasalis TaxID=42839 RepID=UPI00215A5D7F|nr:ras-related protein Rab-34 [Anopheles aquasalis]
MPLYRKHKSSGRPKLPRTSYEVLNNNVDYGTRQIDHYPRPYSCQVTPYRELDFSERTKRAAQAVVPFLLGPCKAIFIGDVATGKTSLVHRFCHESFEGNDYTATIGLDFEVERFQVLNQAYTLQIWDTAGHERFKCIAQSYYRNASAIVVVFDMTRPDSLLNGKRWLDEALRLNSRTPVLKFLVGTKKDLLDDQALCDIELEAIKMAYEINAEYWPVSARTGENVTKLFRRLTALAFDYGVQRAMETNESLLQPPGNSLLNLYFLRKEKKEKKFLKCFNCTIN